MLHQALTRTTVGYNIGPVSIIARFQLSSSFNYKNSAPHLGKRVMVVCFHVPFIKNTKERNLFLLSITLRKCFTAYYIYYLTLSLTHKDGIIIWFNYSRSLFSPVILCLSSTWIKLWNERSKSIMWVRETSSGESV